MTPPVRPRRFRGIEGITQRLIRHSAQGHWFLATCALLGLVCAICALPVIPIIVTACLVSPQRWRSVAASVALSCSLGAVILVVFFHFFGWSVVYRYFPEFLHHPAWKSIQEWVSSYGEISLLAIAASPLPEMPALIVLGVSKPNVLGVFLAIAGGKLVKYGFLAWFASRFPDKFTNGFNGLLRRLQKS